MVRIDPELLSFTGHNAEADQPIQPVVGAGSGFKTKVREELDIVLRDRMLWWLRRVGLNCFCVFGSWSGPVQAVGPDVDVVVVGCAY